MNGKRNFSLLWFNATFRWLFAGFVLATLHPTRADWVFPHINDISINRSSVFSLPFTVEGQSTGDVSIEQISVAISNPGLLPAPSGSITKTSTNFVLLLAPVACTGGISVITLVFTKDGFSATNHFVLTVNWPGEPPVYFLRTPASLVGSEDIPLPILLSAHVDACFDVVLQIEPKNKALFASTNFFLTAQQATNFSVNLQPLPDQFGDTELILSVTGGGGSSSIAVPVRVLPVNDAPQIGFLGNTNFFATYDCITNKPGLAFTVIDPDDSADDLAVGGHSANTNVVADQDVTISHTGTNYLLTFQKARPGTVNVTVTATDRSGGTASKTFTITFLGGPLKREAFAVSRLDIDHVELTHYQEACAELLIQSSTNMVTWQDRGLMRANELWRATWVDEIKGRRMFYRVVSGP